VPRFSAFFIEETEFHALRNAREQCEIHTATVVGGAKRIGFSGTQPHENVRADRRPALQDLVELQPVYRSCTGGRLVE
jgi:hypothetical protein